MKAQFETLKEKREMDKISNYFMEKKSSTVGRKV